MGRKPIFEPSKENSKIIEEYRAFRVSLNKAKGTLKSERQTLIKVASYLDGISLKEADEKALQGFFSTITKCRTRDTYGTTLIRFYRWVNNLPKGQRAPCMAWYEHSKSKDRERESDADPKRFLITPEAYRRIMDLSRDRFGMYEALWETYYLSGGRRNEVLTMKVGDVIFGDKSTRVRLNESKTKPREIPLSGTPEKLIRWLNNHPLNNNPRVSAWDFVKNNPEVPLWVCLSNRNYLEQMTPSGIEFHWNHLSKALNLPYTVHDFRRTRASMMLSVRTKDGGPLYDDRQIAIYFGIKTTLVNQWREWYDLRPYDDLMRQIEEGVHEGRPDYDLLQQQKQELESKHAEQIQKLQTQMANVLKALEIKAQVEPMLNGKP